MFDDHCCPQSDCAPKKNNCKKECCTGIPVVTPDLSMVRSVPILTKRIFDCMYLENPQFATTSNPLTFAVTSVPPTQSVAYADGAPVCVDKICVKYDLIAPALDGNYLAGTIKACSNTVTPSPVAGSTKPFVYDTESVTLSNHYSFTISNNSCCIDDCIAFTGSKCKIIEQNLELYIANLKIYVYGKIGCLPFTGLYTPEAADTAIPITDLGFTGSINFFGKLCMPSCDQIVNIDETFSSCLSVDCIEPTAAGYDLTTNNFTANVESSLSITKQIYSLIDEKLSVFTVPTPEPQECHGPDLTPCPCDCCGAEEEL